MEKTISRSSPSYSSLSPKNDRVPTTTPHKTLETISSSYYHGLLALKTYSSQNDRVHTPHKSLLDHHHLYLCLGLLETHLGEEEIDRQSCRTTSSFSYYSHSIETAPVEGRCLSWRRQIPQSGAESQWIAVRKLLYQVQHSGWYVSRLQTIRCDRSGVGCSASEKRAVVYQLP